MLCKFNCSAECWQYATKNKTTIVKKHEKQWSLENYFHYLRSRVRLFQFSRWNQSLSLYIYLRHCFTFRVGIPFTSVNFLFLPYRYEKGSNLKRLHYGHRLQHPLHRYMTSKNKSNSSSTLAKLTKLSIKPF